ncbi:unnamed protein product [Candida verbasci]|uniref:Zn(2)-C6 fungal-type domain-containing protein n=1 Tax=Candida verbasci TaxID=1227364 RepID=A0A9W4XLT4_9ASCO|nr:unnamed protein product [Candida verbasci]
MGYSDSNLRDDSSSTSSPPIIPQPLIDPGYNNNNNNDHIQIIPEQHVQNQNLIVLPSPHLKPKPKRQRRSYSCGPCKILKIKCDLQIPCTSCKKFKRTNRCLLQPPQPPNEQELNKIQERKKRSLGKKMKFSNDFVQAYNNNSESIPSLITSLGETSRNLRLAKEGESFTVNNEQANPNLESNNSIETHPINFISFPSNILKDQGPTNHDLKAKHKLMNKDQDLIEYLLILDSQKEIDLTMVDVKRIKRLLPSNFQIFNKLYHFYINSIIHIYVDLQNYEEIIKQSKLIYEKLLSIDDENTRNLSMNIKFNVVELRNLSLFFIILSNGLLFDNELDGSFLLEKSLYKPKEDIIEDWIKISKFLKLKLLSYENLTDLIYLIDWYLILKNYYTYKFSNQLKNSLVPHSKLLDLLYGKNGNQLSYELDKFSIKVWGTYYKRSKHSTSIRAIIKNYLELYANVYEILADDLKEFEKNYKTPTYQLSLKDIGLLLMNQQILLLFIKCNDQESFDYINDLLHSLKSKVKVENWEILMNRYFGSKDNFCRYMEKVYDLFKYLSTNPEVKNVAITNAINLNDELVNNTIGKLTGWEFNNNIVHGYLKLIVEPNIDD